MGLTFALAPPVIRFLTAGDVEYTDGLTVLEAAFRSAAAADPAGGWHLLFDIRESTENRPSDDLRGVAAVIAAHRPILSGRCAVVATNPLHYGLGRMFGVFMDGLGFEVRVFYRADEADRWLAAG